MGNDEFVLLRRRLATGDTEYSSMSHLEPKAKIYLLNNDISSSYSISHAQKPNADIFHLYH